MTRRDSEHEHAEETRLRELLGTLVDDVRAPVGFRADVMRAIEAEAEPWWKRIADWLIQPQAVRIRPAAGALVLAASVALLVILPGDEPVPVPQPTAGAAAEPVTRFVLVAPNASSVHLTGDFVSWSPEGIALVDQRGTGVWTADVALPPGVYQYTFVVNGTDWVTDPQAISQVDDGFGQLNSVVIVPAGGEA